MSAPIADALVLIFPAGSSLRAWQERGVIARERAMLHALLAHYRRVVLVTHGGPDDPGVLADLTPDASPGRLAVVCNDAALSADSHTAALPAKVGLALTGCTTAVVRTLQMNGSDSAVRIVSTLRAAGIGVGFIARGGGLWTRFVAYEHGPQSPQALSAAAKERVLCQAADIVVGTTSDMVEDLAWRYGLEPQRCVVVPNYVLVDRPPTTIEQRDPGLLLYAGQLSRRKRVDLLIHAMAQLPEATRQAVRLEVHGVGPDLPTLEALARELNAPVSFPGRVPHEVLLERMSKCAIYVQAADLEGHPKAVLEAMGTGATVLVAKSPGLGEVVTHGMNGLRADSDPAAFSVAIDELIRDPEWRGVLGAAAARTIRQQFGLPSVINLETEVHRRALARGIRTPSRVAA